MTKTCGKRMWSYDNWSCQRPKWHWGRHRFNNYTGTRIPHVWEVWKLIGTFKTNRKLMSYRKPSETRPRLFSYRQVLFPNRFDPIPVDSLRVASEPEGRETGTEQVS